MGLLHVLLQVGVVISMSGPMNPRQLAALQDESNALWNAYGVKLVWFDHTDDCGSAEMVVTDAPIDVWLRVETVEGTRPEPLLPSLGFVNFIGDVPGHTMYLRYGALSHLVSESRKTGWDFQRLPVPIRDQLIGRALGRVVAHELGHVLLESRSHDSGLMRATLGAGDLLTPARDHLGLSRKAVTQLSKTLRSES